MSTIPISEIIIPDDRIRRDFDEEKLKDLAASIIRLGLIHPICLRDDAKTLVAGERRTRAHQMILEMDPGSFPLNTSQYADDFLDSEEIPYTTMGELTPSQRLEAELEENTHRDNLSWQEQTKAEAALHALRVEQHGEGAQGKSDGWNVTKTAEEIVGHTPTSADRMDVSDSLLLDEFLDDPIVAAAGSKKEAIKILNDLERARVRKEKSDNWNPEDADHQVYNSDCYEFEPSTALFDCIIVDPPYGRGMDKHSFANPHKYDDSRETFKKFMTEFPSYAYATLTPSLAHMYIFHDIRDFEKLYIEVEVGGWKVWPWPLIWDKGNVGTYGAPDQGPRHVYDAILFANKGDKPCIMMQRDVINITQDTTLPHPAGKPIELYAELLKRSTEPGDYVLDPMCGGGTIFPAASRLKLHATGIEVDEKYYHMSVEMAMEGK